MFEPNTIKTLLTMKREKKNEAAAGVTGTTEAPLTKVQDSTTMTSNIGFSTIQESLNLTTEMDNYIKDLQKWKKDYAENEKKQEKEAEQEKLAKRPKQPTPSKAFSEEKEKMEKELVEVNAKCDAEVKEITASKAKMLEIQRQKEEIDKKLSISQQNLESKNATKQVTSSLDELQSQLKFDTEEMSSLVSKIGIEDKAVGAGKAEENKAGDGKVSKILAELDQDMKELDDLLKKQE